MCAPLLRTDLDVLMDYFSWGKVEIKVAPNSELNRNGGAFKAEVGDEREIRVAQNIQNVISFQKPALTKESNVAIRFHDCLITS